MGEEGKWEKFRVERERLLSEIGQKTRSHGGNDRIAKKFSPFEKNR